MGKWDRRWTPRRRYNNNRYKDYDYEEPPPTPPSPHHPQSNPPLILDRSGSSWEIDFCKSVHVPWHKVLTAKKFMYCHENVLAWDDSAGKEAFHNAKQTYWEKINGLPSETSLPDPDMYIDKLDWNPKIDSGLMADIDGIYFNPDEMEYSRKLDGSAEKVSNQDPGFDPDNGSNNPWEKGSSPKASGLNGHSDNWGQNEKSISIKNVSNPWEKSRPTLVEAANNSTWTWHVDHEIKDNRQCTAGGWNQDSSAGGWNQDGSAGGWKQEGLAREGWKQDGSARGGWTQDSSARGGWKQDGSARGGWKQDGSARGGWIQDGSPRGGWIEDGSTRGGWRQDGSTRGGWRQDGSTRGGWRQDGLTRTGWKQEVSTGGGWKQEVSTRGGWKQEVSTRESWNQHVLTSGWKQDGLTRGWKQEGSSRGWKPRNTSGHYQQNSEDNVHTWQNNFVSDTRAPENEVWDGKELINNFKGPIESERAGQSGYRKRERPFSSSQRYKTSRLQVDDNGTAYRWQEKPSHKSVRFNV